MKRGEKNIFIGIGVLVGGSILYSALMAPNNKDPNSRSTEIPFYSNAAPELKHQGESLIKSLNCRECHSLWTLRDAMQAVPSPPLDGIGSLKDEQWLYTYLSAVSPQDIVPSRLKPEYRMPSYASLSEAERRTLASYLASLKVRDWYLDEVRKQEFEKLTGNTYGKQP